MQQNTRNDWRKKKLLLKWKNDIRFLLINIFIFPIIYRLLLIVSRMRQSGYVEKSSGLIVNMNRFLVLQMTLKHVPEAIIRVLI